MNQWDDQIEGTNNDKTQHFLNACYVLDALMFHIIISFNPHNNLTPISKDISSSIIL